MNNITFNDASDKLKVALSTGGASEVSKGYVDSQDALTLASAKEYADTKAYDDTEIKEQLEDKANKADVDTELELKQDKLTAGNNITITGNVISSNGGGGTSYDDTEVRGLIAENKTAITTKVDKETGKGLFTGSYNDLKDKPTIPAPYDDSTILALVNANTVNLTKKANADEVPSKTSQLTNDSGFLTEHQDLSTLATKAEVTAYLSVKADKATTYTKTEIDEMLGDIDTALTEIIGG